MTRSPWPRFGGPGVSPEVPVIFDRYRLMQHAKHGDGVITEYPNPHELARTSFALVGSGVHMWIEGLAPDRHWVPAGRSKREGLRSWLIDHFAECGPCSLAASAKIGDDPDRLAFLGLNPAPEPEITVERGRPSDEHYPKAGSHLWNEFAYLAIEAGGYSDLTAVNPYTGDRCHTFACRTGGTLAGEWIDNPYTCLRNLIDAMERVDFLGKTARSADDPSQQAEDEYLPAQTFEGDIDAPAMAVDDDPIDRQDEARGDFTPGSSG